MSKVVEAYSKNEFTRDQVDLVRLTRLQSVGSCTIAETPTHYVLTMTSPVAASGNSRTMAAGHRLDNAAMSCVAGLAARGAGSRAGGLDHLSAIETPFPVADLEEPALRELQAALGLLGYPVGEVDGAFGPKTRNAWAEFKTDVLPGNTALIGRESIATIRERLENLPSLDAPDLSTREATIAAIREECIAQRIGLPAQVAYVLATAQWETAQTFKPVKEAFWLSEQWRRDNLRYYPFYGRGYVQLTWKNNYKAYSDLLAIDMVADPDLALDGRIALFVLVHGFKTGTFTGRKITDFIDANRTDFVNARRCINGSDKANEIALLAEAFLATS
jgi:peptidoglycan hydrolase-like protein with peptidoglycan-binding domain